MKDKFNKIDKTLLFVTIILTVLGLIMIFSSSSIAAVLQYGNTEYYFFKKQLIVVLAGFFLSFIIYFIPTDKYKELSVIGIVAIIAALIALKTYGSVTNNAQSWFRVFGFSIQPSEFAKTFIILFLACVYGSKKKFETVYNLFIPLIPCVVIFLLVCLEPDLGTAAIIAIICMFIFFSLPVGKDKMLNILKTSVIIIILFAVFALQTNQKYLTDTQSNRFNFKNPCNRYLEETGYQVCNGYIAIHNGGLWGVGLGKSTQKYLYLPEAYTDFIFPIVVEELGMVGGLVVLALYILLLFKILEIARNASNLRGSIIAFGTFGYILTHIGVNLGGILALIPLTGVPLPFLSYGGSFMINLLILLALTQRVAIETKENKYKKEVKKVVGGK
ncbi:MAG: FtsW/RodA/SpoVE family cell cycle protein [Bacilli bacterium]|nr:FtsW/RodA/SpoVE family cell cycle protein [Bacilli bacterium]